MKEKKKSSSFFRKKNGRIDTSKLLFFFSFLLGSGTVIYDIVTPDRFFDGVIVSTIASQTYDFLVWLIGIFTANYLGRRATDSFHAKSLGLKYLDQDGDGVPDHMENQPPEAPQTTPAISQPISVIEGGSNFEPYLGDIRRQ